MTTSPHPIKITAVLWGTLKFRGRLLKQISTLQDAGLDCRLVYGDRGEVPLVRDDYPYPIDVIPTPWDCHPLQLFFRQLGFCFKAGKHIAASDASHVLCFGLQSLLAGVLAKRRKPSLKLIFDSNELYIEHFINPVKKWLWHRVQKYCVPYCDVIMHAEQNRLEYFIKHHDPKAAPDKHFLLENLPSHIPADQIRAKPGRPPTRVLYVGVMGVDRYTKELIDIFRGLAPDFSLDLVGPCPDEFRAELDQMAESAANVRVLPPIPYNGMSELIQDYHVGIALYKNDNLNNYYCAPNKVYDYLMNGAAVVANNYPGLLQVIEKPKVGACIEQVSLEEFRKALGLIVDEARWNNVTEELRKRHSWEHQVEGYLKLFNPARG